MGWQYQCTDTFDQGKKLKLQWKFKVDYRDSYLGWFWSIPLEVASILSRWLVKSADLHWSSQVSIFALNGKVLTKTTSLVNFLPISFLVNCQHIDTLTFGTLLNPFFNENRIFLCLEKPPFRCLLNTPSTFLKPVTLWHFFPFFFRANIFVIWRNLVVKNFLEIKKSVL